MGGNLFERLGVLRDLETVRPRGPLDEGRKRVTRSDEDDAVFRVPSLRLAARTNPYFHDGSVALERGLREVAVRADLGQLFLNLVMNAAQAIPEGRAAENQIRVETTTDERGRAVIAIADTGAGMSPEVQARLFTPFFTTKAPGVGTGLGLSICLRIASELGGAIQVTSAVGSGTLPSDASRRAC